VGDGDPVQVRPQPADVPLEVLPGVVACLHHMGRWKLAGHSRKGAGGMMAAVALEPGEEGEGDAGSQPRSAVFFGGSGYGADLVVGHRRSPESRLSRPP
jgi:hypothetical protein